MKKKFISLVVLCLVIAQPASAVTSTYTDRGLFESTLGTFILDDYSDPDYSDGTTSKAFNDAEMSAVLGETDYTATAFSLHFVSTSGRPGDPFYCSGCNGSFLLGFTTTSVGDSSGVYGVGFDIVQTLQAITYYAFVTFGDGSTANYEMPFVDQIGGAQPEFFGITSDLKIKTIHLGLIDGGITSTVVGRIEIDNLTIGSAAIVTEPATASLLLLAGLAGLSRRRRR